MKRRLEYTDIRDYCGYSGFSDIDSNYSDSDYSYDSEEPEEIITNKKTIINYLLGTLRTFYNNLLDFVVSIHNIPGIHNNNTQNTQNNFKVKLLQAEACLPSKLEPGSAGYDVFSVENKIIQPGTRSLVGIGISTEFPNDYYIRCAPRSGLSVNYSIDIGAGVIDSSYRGEIKVLVINNGKDDFKINMGDKIAQLIFEKIENPTLTIVDNLNTSIRNSKGFGSSGINQKSKIF